MYNLTLGGLFGVFFGGLGGQGWGWAGLSLQVNFTGVNIHCV